MTYHPDHIAVHHWVTAAWRRRGCSGRLLYATPSVEFLAQYRQDFEEWDMYMTDQRPTGVPAEQLGTHLRLHGPELDRKLTALRAMASQTNGLVAALGPDRYAAYVNEEWFMDAPRPRVRRSTPADSRYLGCASPATLAVCASEDLWNAGRREVSVDWSPTP